MHKQTAGGRGQTLRTLFWTFFKIGAFTFGGGYAMIALLENECVSKRGWVSREEFLDMAAIAESTPGPVAINSATYLGYKLAGVPGSAAATLAVCLPSFAIIYLISLFFDRFLALAAVGWAFQGIRAGVIYLIASAGLRMLGGLGKSRLNACILAAVLGGMLLGTLFAAEPSSICFILLSGAAGLAAWGVARAAQKGGR